MSFAWAFEVMAVQRSLSYTSLQLFLARPFGREPSDGSMPLQGVEPIKLAWLLLYLGRSNC
jgi:hypothetical protein